MPTFTEEWGGYSVAYNTDGGARTLVVRLPNRHEITGPAGTLLGLTDLTSKVLDAVARNSEEEIAGGFRWPPAGYFVSQAVRMKPDGPITRLLSKDWTDPDQIWWAPIFSTADGAGYSVSTGLGVRHWRELSAALSRLMENDEIRLREKAAAIPV